MIPGKATGKGRPRFVRATGRTYTDAQTVSYENLVKVMAVEAGCKPLEGRVALRITIEAIPPPSWSNKRRHGALRGIEAPRKPDVDNCAKLVMDALNGVAYDDDVQVSHLSVIKRYGDADCVTITVGAAA